MNAYTEFLARKHVRAAERGLTEVPALNPALFAFQRDIVTWALRRGRAAVFASTGLGKTAMQLEWARVIAAHTGLPVIIFAPLAVAQQTVAEAAKFGIEGITYAADQAGAATPIVVTNYDRLEKFDLSKFGGVVLDESSIIKAHESQTRRRLIELCAGIAYALCCTATPAPNDYVELGQHSEFLGVLSAKEMLATWFVHEGSIRATSAQNFGSKPVAEWRLKRHAADAFWAWVASWAVMIRRPSDLGYSDDGFILPPLHKHQITVPADYTAQASMGLLFPMQARTLKERLGARRDSIAARVAAAAEIVNRQPDRPWLVWCNLNAEGEALRRAIPDAVEVRGPDDPDSKSANLLGFVHGRPRILISKPSIAGWGMNWQHCADMVFVGLNDSFEQLFQAMRRCWRFGQTKPVNSYLIASELEGQVVANLEQKEAAYEAMAQAMAEHMRDLCRREIQGGRAASHQLPAKKSMELPAWLTAA